MFDLNSERSAGTCSLSRVHPVVAPVRGRKRVCRASFTSATLPLPPQARLGASPQTLVLKTPLPTRSCQTLPSSRVSAPLNFAVVSVVSHTPTP